MSELLLRRGEWELVDPTSAGWRYLSFRVETMHAGEERKHESGDQELALVPLAGSCSVAADEGEWEVGGRVDVFSGLPRSLYLPRDTAFSLRAQSDAEIALCGARADRRREPRPIAPDEVEIEVRGAGNATRQINHIVKPDFPAERLLVVEVYTPSGNWSSYPPHKHDEDHGEREAVLEETYYFSVLPQHACRRPPHDGRGRRSGARLDPACLGGARAGPARPARHFVARNICVSRSMSTRACCGGVRHSAPSVTHSWKWTNSCTNDSRCDSNTRTARSRPSASLRS